MTLRSHALATLILSTCFWLSGLGHTAMAADTGGSERVVKLISTSADGFGGFMGRGQDNNKAPAWVVVSPVDGGKASRLSVADDFRKSLDQFANNKGQLVTITVAGKGAGTAETVSSIARYDGNKALLNSKAYQFDGLGQLTVGGQASVTLKVSRAGQSKEIPVGSRAGTGQPDTALLARLKTFSPGDLIEIELAAGKATAVVVDALLVTEPVVGEFVKLATAKDAENKSISVMLIDVAGEQRAYALPAATASAGATPSPQASASAAAVQTLGKRLKPGHTISFTLREKAAAAAPANADSTKTTQPSDAGNKPKTAADPVKILGTIRDLKVDGRVEPTGEKSIDVISTYVRIEFSESRGRGFGFGGRGGNNDAAPAGTMDVEYHPGEQRDDRQSLVKGIERVLESEDDAKRANISLEQAQRLDAAIKPIKSKRAAGAEQTQWTAAYQAWMNARDDDARRKVEQEILFAAQELSLRLRRDLQTADAAIKSVLKASQVEELQKLGKENRPPRFGGRGFGKN